MRIHNQPQRLECMEITCQRNLIYQQWYMKEEGSSAFLTPWVILNIQEVHISIYLTSGKQNQQKHNWTKLLFLPENNECEGWWKSRKLCFPCLCWRRSYVEMAGRCRVSEANKYRKESAPLSRNSASRDPPQKSW